MKKNIFYILIFFESCASAQEQKENMLGPLRVSEANPRYFTDDSGDAIYLTGSHTWDNLVEMKSSDGQADFDYIAFIKWMKKSNFNFMRLWAWELLNWETGINPINNPQTLTVYPHPWERTGPGNALDGKPRFDLNYLLTQK